MREIWVRNIAVLTGAMLVVLSVAFACRQDADTADGADAADSARAQPALAHAAIERGRTLYAAQGCSSCHSIGGAGNPRFPLDDVGARRNADALRDWMLGTGPAASVLTARSLREKERFRALPSGDIDALIAYLGTLRGR